MEPENTTYPLTFAVWPTKIWSHVYFRIAMAQK